LPKTIKTVLGYGYDITSHYAYSPDIKPAVLDLDKLLEAQRVKEDPNLKYGEFETISGKDINEYMRNITAKVSYSANATF
jgi:homospermidine synthase